MRVTGRCHLDFSSAWSLPQPGPEVQFTDITRSARVNFKHENSATSNKYLLETMGGRRSPPRL